MIMVMRMRGSVVMIRMASMVLMMIMTMDLLMVMAVTHRPMYPVEQQVKLLTA